MAGRLTVLLPLGEGEKKKTERKEKGEAEKERKKRDGKTPPQPAGKRSNGCLGTSSLSWALPQAAAAPPSPFSSSPGSLSRPCSAALLGPSTALAAACCEQAQIVCGYYRERLLCQ